MAIDDPKAAFEQQYMQQQEKSALGLALFTAKLAFPKAALPLGIFQKLPTDLHARPLKNDYKQCGIYLSSRLSI